MEESDTKTPQPDTAASLRNLKEAVIILAILPLVLPFLFDGPVVAELRPRANEVWSHCGFDCPAATDLERMGWLLILGPSFLVAVVSILFGTIKLVHARRHPTSLETINWFQASILSGVVWVILLGCLYGAIWWISYWTP
jgi:hypothetical protein